MRYTVAYVIFNEEGGFLNASTLFVETSQTHLDALMPVVEDAIAREGVNDSYSDIKYGYSFGIMITKNDKERVHTYSVYMRCIDGIIEYSQRDEEDNGVIRWW